MQDQYVQPMVPLGTKQPVAPPFPGSVVGNFVASNVQPLESLLGHLPPTISFKQGYTKYHHSADCKTPYPVEDATPYHPYCRFVRFKTFGREKLRRSKKHEFRDFDKKCLHTPNTSKILLVFTIIGVMLYIAGWAGIIACSVSVAVNYSGGYVAGLVVFVIIWIIGLISIIACFILRVIRVAYQITPDQIVLIILSLVLGLMLGIYTAGFAVLILLLVHTFCCDPMTRKARRKRREDEIDNIDGCHVIIAFGPDGGNDDLDASMYLADVRKDRVKECWELLCKLITEDARLATENQMCYIDFERSLLLLDMIKGSRSVERIKLQWNARNEDFGSFLANSLDLEFAPMSLNGDEIRIERPPGLLPSLGGSGSSGASSGSTSAMISIVSRMGPMGDMPSSDLLGGGGGGGGGGGVSSSSILERMITFEQRMVGRIDALEHKVDLVLAQMSGMS